MNAPIGILSYLPLLSCPTHLWLASAIPASTYAVAVVYVVASLPRTLFSILDAAPHPALRGAASAWLPETGRGAWRWGGPRIRCRLKRLLLWHWPLQTLREPTPKHFIAGRAGTGAGSTSMSRLTPHRIRADKGVLTVSRGLSQLLRTIHDPCRVTPSKILFGIKPSTSAFMSAPRHIWNASSRSTASSPSTRIPKANVTIPFPVSGPTMLLSIPYALDGPDSNRNSSSRHATIIRRVLEPA